MHPTMQQQQQPHAVLKSAFQWRDCVSNHVHHPITTDEVADLVEVLQRDMDSSGRHYLIRSSHNFFFSHNELTGCTDVGDSPTQTIMLDLSRMNQVLRLDVDEGTVTVQAGITFEVSEGAGGPVASSEKVPPSTYVWVPGLLSAHILVSPPPSVSSLFSPPPFILPLPLRTWKSSSWDGSSAWLAWESSRRPTRACRCQRHWNPLRTAPHWSGPHP